MIVITLLYRSEKVRNAHAADDVHIARWRVSNGQAMLYRLEPSAVGHTSFCESEAAVTCGVAPCMRSS
jgi:hypothetical protein